jgi:cytochrome b subunit of formate dehydrogenase
MTRLVLVALGAVVLVVAFGASYALSSSGAQPWGQLLGDNFLFARTLPFSIGLGIGVGYWRASGWRWHTEQRPSDGALRRFAPGTVLLHAVSAVALVVLIATGGWQYLKGLLDAETPVYMGTVYRIHYLAASVLIFVSVVFVTDWRLRGERSLSVGKGERIRSLRGLAHELPRPLGATIGYMLGLDLRRAAPPTDQFTYYERTFSFPTWTIAIALIIVTGVIKAMRYIYPIPGDILYWISALHVASGVLVGMKLLDHLRYVLAPSRWPLMAAMATGWVAEGYVRRFHPAWYARLTSDGALASPSPTRTPTAPTGHTPPSTSSPVVGSAGGAS